MGGRITRRQLVRALGVGAGVGALTAAVAPVQGAGGPAFVRSGWRGVVAGQDQEAPADEATEPIEPLPDEAPDPAEPVPEEAPFNVWQATTTSELPKSVADLPPRVYVPHELGGDVAVIDPATMQIVDRFSVGRTPHHVTPAHDFSLLYVNVMDSNWLTVIDPRVGRPIGTIPAAVPYNLYFSPDGTKAIVAAERYNRLDFYDPGSWQVLARVPIPGSGVDHLDFSADGSYLLVGCEFGGQVVKVNVHHMAVEAVARPGGLPVDVKLSPDGTVFYVANQGRHGVSVIDPIAMREIDFLPTGRGAHGMAISRDGKLLYVANRAAGTISVIDCAAGAMGALWPIGGTVDMLQVSPDGALWASGRAHGEVYVINTGNGQLVHRLRTGAGPHGLTYFPQPGRFSVGHNGVYR